jgi:riboflavin kinase/FMN adenylyltransferase
MIVALGAFDGFHLGHQSLFKAASSLSSVKSDTWGVVTFSPHPGQVLFPAASRLIFSEEEKHVLESYLGIPKVIRILFDLSLATVGHIPFLELLFSIPSLSGIVVGDNFRFGAGRTGDTNAIRAACDRARLIFRSLPRIKIGNRVISSSAIRRLIQCGYLEEAREWLGHHYFLSGRVVHGNGRGRALGFPTANIAVPIWKILPPEGVYAALAVIRGERKIMRCALSIGENPTFGDVAERRIEAHILDGESDFYEKNMCILPLVFLRESVRFATPAELKKRISEDVDTVSNLNEMHPGFSTAENFLLSLSCKHESDSPGRIWSYDAQAHILRPRGSG